MFRHIRRVFLTGLFVSLPLVVTILVIKLIFQTLDGVLGPYIVPLLIKAGVPLSREVVVPGLGVAATLVIIFLVGLFTTNYVGKRLWEMGEKLVNFIPGVNSVYTAVKQVIETFSMTDADAFRKVVMIEYPRKGIWCLAFITGDTKGEAQLRTEKKLINIFLPTTPNPTSGFLLLLPREDVVELAMSVEEGIKMIVSGGIVTPPYDLDSNENFVTDSHNNSIEK